MRINSAAAFLAAILLAILSACSQSQSARPFADRLAEADAALTQGDIDRAQNLANEMFCSALGADSTSVTDADAARLGILFMQLAEHRNEDENVADAAQCIRRAMRLSADSLKSFFASLPLEDTPRYVVMRRIGLSIDNPMELPVSEPHDIEPDSLP